MGFLETESIAEICKQKIYWEERVGTTSGRKRLDGAGLDRRKVQSQRRPQLILQRALKFPQTETRGWDMATLTTHMLFFC